MTSRYRYDEWTTASPSGPTVILTHLPESPADRLNGAACDRLARELAEKLTHPRLEIVDARFVRSHSGDHSQLMIRHVPRGYQPTPYVAPIPVLCAAHLVGVSTPNSAHVSPVGTGSYQLYTAGGQPAGRFGGDWTADLPELVRRALRQIESLERSYGYAVAVVERRIASPGNRARARRGWAPAIGRGEIQYFHRVCIWAPEYKGIANEIERSTQTVLSWLASDWPAIGQLPETTR